VVGWAAMIYGWELCLILITLPEAGCLNDQIEFVQQYDKENEEKTWINILDKGYRITKAAWRVGGQFVFTTHICQN
jgi:hypothetical protein